MLENFNTLWSELCEKNNLTEFNNDIISKKLNSLLDILCEQMKYMNLSAIKEPREIALKHFIDSLTISKYIPKNSNVLDVGCGAGFPSLPLAIARPDLNIVSLDSTEKKLTFVKNTSDSLDLSNISILNGRAEELSHNDSFREHFDIVCSRAVAPFNILSEICIPFIKTNGLFIAMKSKNANEEVASAQKALIELNSEIIQNDSFNITDQEPLERTVLVIKKISSTKKAYPRRWSTIEKKPL